MAAEIPTEHPHIVRQPGVCGGAPSVRGTRITVRHIATLWKEGESVAEILQSFPHLSLAAIHDAISYYLDHQAEIDREIESNRIENVVSRLGAVMDEKGIVHFPKGTVRDEQR